MDASYLVFDTETTGIPNYRLPADHPSQPRICQITALGTDESRRTRYAFTALIRPEPDWPEPSPQAMAANGLTLELLRRHGIPIVDALAIFNRFIDCCTLMIGHNPNFDFKMLRGEFRRNKMPDRYGERPYFCTQVHSTNFCKLPPTDKMIRAGRTNFKSPKLEEAVRICLGREHTNAHSAIADVNVCKELFFWLLDQGVKPEGRFHEKSAAGNGGEPESGPSVPSEPARASGAPRGAQAPVEGII